MAVDASNPPTAATAPAALALFEHMADAVYLLDPETSRVLWGNRAAWESLGLSADEVLNHSVLSLQMDVTGAPQWSEIAAVIRSVPCFTFVGRHRHAAGHEVAVEVNTTRFFDQGREYFLSVARDVSRRVALEAELKTREGQLWFALNEAMDGLWDWDIPSGRVYFSPQLKRMLGYGPDELTPELDSWANNIHPEDSAQVHRVLEQHLVGRRARYEAEYRLRNRNGQYLWVLDRGRVCERDAQGQPTRVVGMVQDVTQEREARHALQRSEQAQRTLIAALPDVIMRLDLDGRHLFVSENIGTLSPLPVAAILGRTHEELGLPEDTCEHWNAAMAEVQRSGQAHETQFDLDTLRGRRTLNCRLVPEQDANGRVCTVLAICRDVTERRQAEEELARHRDHLEELVAQRTAALRQAMAEAEAANRAKSRFLATMSHELRTPLGAIMGMASLARERATDPALQQQLDTVAQASQHLLGLISDILDLSRIEAEQMTLHEAVFTLEPVLDSVQRLAAPKAQDKGLRLMFSLDPVLAGRAWLGDALRFKQVLLNLVDNAIKYTPDGLVRVEAVETAEGLLRFDITDDGPGIDPHDLERLFLPFEQAGNAAGQQGGVGLGLAIARELVGMMGGEINVDSVPGQGSRFWFTVRLRPAGMLPGPLPTVLPEESAGTAAALARDAVARHFAGCTVLVAEDDPVSREICSALLDRAGLQVTTAEDGEVAAKLAEAQPFDLVVMDMQMPGRDGMAVTVALRTAGPNRDTPVVALTANAFDDDRQRCLAAGMDAFLTKPIDVPLLYATVARLLATGRTPPVG
ncbi:MAG: PAS domain S-box protein [Burkholderiaceae bacterium]|nr:PAS domain S-box protein [Rhodoferax sp.]MCP5284847.1 PAS domain S-box protein [Burkholderiaceae bacterium]